MKKKEIYKNGKLFKTIMKKKEFNKNGKLFNEKNTIYAKFK